MEPEPDALDQKGNRYYRRKLLKREFLLSDLMKLTFELPKDTSLQSMGFDIGLGDFIRMRPFSEEHQKLVENPAGGRAYSPVSMPNTKGKFDLIVKSYGPGGVSSLLKQIPIESELLVTSNVEHVFWKERQKGYWANERNVTTVALDEDKGDGCHICLIAFGIGITEVAPVALSELRDPCVKKVTILWALKRWSDASWVMRAEGDEYPDDLVRQFFVQQKQGRFGDRVQIKFILSQEEHPDCLHGRISADTLKTVFLDQQSKQEHLRFLAVGTAAMITFAYEMLGNLGLDIAMKDHWTGKNLLYRKLSGAAHTSERTASPLAMHDTDDAPENIEPPAKKARM
jgi:ferredoxin-NADP reductase